MTLRSRRKRPTIARSTGRLSSAARRAGDGPEGGHAARFANAVAALWIALGFVAATWSANWALAPCRADDSAGGVVQASHVTAASGGRLRWLPYRANGAVVPASSTQSTAVAAQPPRPTPAAPRVAQRSTVDPFLDPFQEGDLPLRAPGQPDVLSLPGEPPVSIGPAAESTGPSNGARGVSPLPTPDPYYRSTEAPQAESPPTLDLPRAPQSGEPILEGRKSGWVFKGGELSDFRCPQPGDKEYYTPIGELGTDIAPPKANELPLPPECRLSDETLDANLPRPWATTTFTWKASGLCHKPLYFEQVQAERYGHSWGPLVQPVMSHAHFFLTVPALPYKMGLTPPKECMYTLGYYRPGSCAPYMLDPLPLSVRAAAWEAGAVLGAVYILP